MQSSAIVAETSGSMIGIANEDRYKPQAVSRPRFERHSMYYLFDAVIARTGSFRVIRSFPMSIRWVILLLPLFVLMLLQKAKNAHERIKQKQTLMPKLIYEPIGAITIRQSVYPLGDGLHRFYSFLQSGAIPLWCFILRETNQIERRMVRD